MRISDGSSDVCSSDLPARLFGLTLTRCAGEIFPFSQAESILISWQLRWLYATRISGRTQLRRAPPSASPPRARRRRVRWCGNVRPRSEEHTSELQSLMRISYAVFCLTKNNTLIIITTHDNTQYT